MAAPSENTLARKTMHFAWILSLLIAPLGAGNELSFLDPSEVQSSLKTSCVLALDSAKASEETVATFQSLKHIFHEEDGVTIATLDAGTFVWPSGHSLEWEDSKSATSSDIVFFAKIAEDRSCLLTPKRNRKPPPAVAYSGPASVNALVGFINGHCGTFRKSNGDISLAGLHRQDILSNFFRVGTVSDVTMGQLYSTPDSSNPFQASARWPGIQEKLKGGHGGSEHCDADGSCDEDNAEDTENKYTRSDHTGTVPSSGNVIPQCDTVDATTLTKETFFHDFVKRSRPVVFKKAVNSWPAFTKWTTEFFKENFGKKDVHIKLTPGGDFEGVEKAELWDSYGKFQIPPDVQSKLSYPDLVVVRPAGVNMKFSDFLDLISLAASQPERNVSAYLEYSSIPQYMPEIESDLIEFPFAKTLLKRRHLNLWLSDGNTVGRLHFDPFDNLLCQLRGQKQVILFEPFDNSQLYEAHIPQATLSYSKQGHKFKRKTLEESTSMVMSPVDILDPDFERFPKFAEARPLNCTIDEGDVLFMPAFWWHEVYSLPNVTEKRNLAVNYWYEPFLHKEFPCADCPMDVNPFYHHLLY